MTAAYATSDQLATYWRALSDAEEARATVLLGYAAALINQLPGALDDDGDPVLDTEIAAMVSMDMVKRAMTGGDGIKSQQQGMADVTSTIVYQSVGGQLGTLYLTTDEKKLLIGGGAAAFSVGYANTPSVPRLPWIYQVKRDWY